MTNYAENVSPLSIAPAAVERNERAVLAARLAGTVGPDGLSELNKVSADVFRVPAYGNAWAIADEIERQGIKPDAVNVAALMGDRGLLIGRISSAGDLTAMMVEAPGATEVAGYVRELIGAKRATDHAIAHQELSKAHQDLAYVNDVHGDPTEALARIEALKAKVETLAPPVPRGALFEPLRNVEAENVEELIDGVMARGELALLIGPDGTGKTFAAVGLALSVLTGQDWLGHLIRHSGPVAYIAAEGRGSIKPRALAWVAHHGRDPDEILDGFHLTTVDAGALALVNSTDTAAIIAELDSLDVPPALVVVDTYAMASGVTDENDNAQAGTVAGNLRRIAEATGAAVLVVHHPKKGEDSNSRGASALRAAMSTVLALTGNGSAIRLDKWRHGQAGEIVSVTLTEGYTVGDTGDGRAPKPVPVMVQGEGAPRITDDDLMELIGEHGGGLREGAPVAAIKADLTDNYGISPQRWNKLRTRLIAEGRIEPASRGYVRIVDASPPLDL